MKLTALTKKAFTLSIAVWLFFAFSAYAQTTYYITSSEKSYTVRTGSATGAAITGGNKVTMSAAIGAIKAAANGAACTIQFGDGTTEINSIISFDGGTNGKEWGLITLTGKLYFNDPGDGTPNSGSWYYKAKIINLKNVSIKTDNNTDFKAISYGTLIANDSAGTVTINGGTFSAGTAIIENLSTGTVNINSGTLYGEGKAVINSGTGTVNISGGTVFSNAKSTSAVHNLGGGTVNISGGTVSGPIDNQDGTVNISGGTVVVDGHCGVSPTTSHVIWTSNGGTVNISGGMVSLTGCGSTIDVGKGIVNISGGTVSATGGGIAINAHQYSDFKITVSGTAKIKSDYNNCNNCESESDFYKEQKLKGMAGTIDLSANDGDSSSLVITGGIIENTAAGGKAIKTYKGRAPVAIVLGGSPSITGIIDSYYALNVSNTFAPAAKVYTLDLSPYSNGALAVVDGAKFLSNFKLHNQPNYSLAANEPYYSLATSGNDIIIASSGLRKYIITPTAYYNFFINRDENLLNSNKVIQQGQDAINIIKADADGAPSLIQFGDGTNAIDLGEVKFDGGTCVNGCWSIAFTGKLASRSTSALGIIRLENGASIDSKAELKATASSDMIFNNSNGTVTISGGIVQAATGYAIKSLGGATILTSGLLFAYGTSVSNVIYGDYDASNGDAVIVAWNQQSGNTTYASNTSDDIYKFPATATAVWTNENGKSGISVINGDNTGFIEVDGVEVSSSQTRIFHNRENHIIGGIGIQTTSNAITLTNLPSNIKVEVYNLQGKRIYSSHPENSKILKIDVQTKGMYIVKIANQTMRTVVM